MKVDRFDVAHSAIANRDPDTDTLIARGLELLIRQQLGFAMKACTRHGDPNEIEHYMGEAQKVMHLRRQINA